MIPGDIGNSIDAGVVPCQEARILQAIARKPVVGVSKAQAYICLAILPPYFGERLPHLRGRKLPPPVLAVQIAGDVPTESAGIGASVLDFPGPSPEATSVYRQRDAGSADPV